ncbi:hypothetical protein ACFY3O_28440 [Streptomyces sp. NPDC001046]|uniref:hypothetical protein n=1 Tax=Streptomyces sp. NPDC001046 TaxID=3364543 RepID=UPI0036AE5DFB
MYMSLRTGRRSLAAVTLALLLASGTVACGGEDTPAAADKADQQPADQNAAEDQSDPGTDSTDSTGGSSGDDDGVAYASCMRQNGVDVPDPQPGEQPQIPDGIARSLLKKAEKACGKAPGSPQQAGGGEFANDPKLEQLGLANQKCLRENGYTVPEPNKDAVKPKAPGEDPVFDRASAACKKTGDELSEYLEKIMGEK